MASVNVVLGNLFPLMFYGLGPGITFPARVTVSAGALCALANNPSSFAWENQTILDVPAQFYALFGGGYFAAWFRNDTLVNANHWILGAPTLLGDDNFGGTIKFFSAACANRLASQVHVFGEGSKNVNNYTNYFAVSMQGAIIQAGFPLSWQDQAGVGYTHTVYTRAFAPVSAEAGTTTVIQATTTTDATGCPDCPHELHASVRAVAISLRVRAEANICDAIEPTSVLP
jgi:hypothetical protein